jgi:exodeoxyribonuclease V alpha subunit
LQRYWQYEVNLAVKLQQLAKSSVDLNNQLAKSLLTTLFDNTGTNPPNSATLGESSLNWQKIAVAIAISQKLCLITGGPGTGKTTTVTKLLALLQGLAAAKQQVLNIQLVAPTGKAAARLTESISAAKQKLPAQLQENLPTQCQTIHRLLGAKPLSPYFKANEKHPLHLDVLVIDEASMVDLPLMSKLFQALPDSAQVIVLGDQQQLASVETGSVLADICQARWAWGGPADHVFSPHKPMAQFSQTLIRQLATLMPELTEYLANEQQQVTNISLIANNVVSLVKSHRFDEHSGIGQLAKAIQAGHHSDVERLLKQPEIDDIGWKKITENPSQLSYQKTSDKVVSDLVSQLTPILKLYCQAVKQKDIQLAFHCLSQQQVLCAQRTGYWGVEHVNQLIEQQLEKLGLVNLTADFYIGRPVMLSKNEHQLNLFNGDMGIVMADPQQSELTKVWFLTPEGDVRGVLPSRLPSLDTVYAMTIHKSQGSEFENVHLCLPPLSDDNKGRGLSKELLYTGLTRAKKRFVLYSQSRALRLCLAQQCIRTSGLTARLVKSRC